MPELKNARWEKFAQLTANGHKRGQAFLGAGFSANRHGKVNLKVAADRGSNLYRAHPEIRARVEEIKEGLREGALKKSGVDREFVLSNLKANHDRAVQAEPVRNRQGEETGQFTFQGSVANRALELMGKELGMFADRIQFESLDRELGDMTASQLRNYIRGAATEVGLRMVDMTNDELRSFILEAAPRVGLVVTPAGGESAGGAEAEEDGGLPPVPDATGVPSGKPH